MSCTERVWKTQTRENYILIEDKMKEIYEIIELAWPHKKLTALLLYELWEHSQNIKQVECNAWNPNSWWLDKRASEIVQARDFLIWVLWN